MSFKYTRLKLRKLDFTYAHPYSIIIIITLLQITSAISSNRFFDAVNQPKEFYFLTILSILLIAASVYVFLKRRTFAELKLHLADIFLIAYLIYISIRAYLSNIYRLNSSEFLILSSLLILYFLLRIILSIADNPKIYLTIVIPVLFIGAFNILWGYLQWIGLLSNNNEFFNIGGSFGNPGVYSNYLVSIFPLLLLNILLYGHDKFKLSRLFRISCIVFTSLAIVLIIALKARTAWIAILFSISLVCWWVLRNLKIQISKLKKKMLKTFILLALLIIGFFLFRFMYSYKQDSANGRILIWENSLEIVAKKPLFGVGFNEFKSQYNLVQGEYFKNNPNSYFSNVADDATYAFNEFLQLLIEQGFIGLILFITPVFIILFSNPNRDKNNFLTYSNIIRLTILSILICASFSYPFHNVAVMVNFILMLAFLSSMRNLRFYSIKMNKSMLVLGSCSLLILGLLILYTTIKRTDASLKWTKISENFYKDYELSEKKYDKIYPVLEHNPDFLFDYGKKLMTTRNNQKSLSILNKSAHMVKSSEIYNYLGIHYEDLLEYDKAESNYLLASYIVPSKLYPRYRLAVLYFNKGEYVKSISMAESVIKDSSKVKNIQEKHMKDNLDKILLEIDSMRIK